MRCKHFTIPLFAFLFVMGALFTPIERAHAIVSCIPTITPTPDVPVAVPVQNFGEAIRQNIANAFHGSNFTKECILDALVTFLKEALIQNLTGSIVDWINNDFEGGPAFVTDPAGFFVNIADETAGNFIERQLGPIGQLLCSPFDLQLRLNLWLSTGASRKQYLGCRLTDIQQNAYEAFTNGGFIANGGWRTFHALTSDPRNNQYGAFLYASDALNNEYVRRVNETLRDLSYGRGFLSFKKCAQWSEGPSEGTGEGGARACLKYKVETPGSLINNQLNNVFGSELRKFELADEINEVFQALVNYGLRQVFTATGGGLRGASKAAAGEASLTSKLIKSNYDAVYLEARTDSKTDRLIQEGYASTTPRDITLTQVGAEIKSGGAGAVPAQERNLALNQYAEQSSTFYNQRYYSAGNAVDGIKEGGEVGDNRIYSAAAITNGTQPNYWGVTLAKTSVLKELRIYSRTDHSLDLALGTVSVVVYNKQEGGKVFEKSYTPNTTPYRIDLVQANGGRAVVGNRVQIIRTDKPERLELAEVEVYGTEGATTPAGTPSPTGVTAPPPSSTPVMEAQANTEATQEFVFTANEPLTNAKIRITVTQKVGGIYKTIAPGQMFSKFLVRVKNPATGAVHFTELFVDRDDKDRNKIAATNIASPYTTTKSFNAALGEDIAVGYEFVPASGAKGQLFGLPTEIINASGVQIPGAVATITIEVK